MDVDPTFIDYKKKLGDDGCRVQCTCPSDWDKLGNPIYYDFSGNSAEDCLWYCGTVDEWTQYGKGNSFGPAFKYIQTIYCDGVKTPKCECGPWPPKDSYECPVCCELCTNGHIVYSWENCPDGGKQTGQKVPCPLPELPCYTEVHRCCAVNPNATSMNDLVVCAPSLYWEGDDYPYWGECYKFGGVHTSDFIEVPCPPDDWEPGPRASGSGSSAGGLGGGPGGGPAGGQPLGTATGGAGDLGGGFGLVGDEPDWMSQYDPEHWLRKKKPKPKPKARKCYRFKCCNPKTGKVTVWRANTPKGCANYGMYCCCNDDEHDRKACKRGHEPECWPRMTENQICYPCTK